MSKQDSENSAVTAELRDIEDQLAAAWVAGDPSVHERVLSDDWSVIDAQGRIRNKAEVLEEMFRPGERFLTGRIDEVNVRPYGDWAVVTGKTHVAGRLPIANCHLSIANYRDFSISGCQYHHAVAGGPIR